MQIQVELFWLYMYLTLRFVWCVGIWSCGDVDKSWSETAPGLHLAADGTCAPASVDTGVPGTEGGGGATH